MNNSFTRPPDVPEPPVAHVRFSANLNGLYAPNQPPPKNRRWLRPDIASLILNSDHFEPVSDRRDVHGAGWGVRLDEHTEQTSVYRVARSGTQQFARLTRVSRTAEWGGRTPSWDKFAKWHKQDELAKLEEAELVNVLPNLGEFIIPAGKVILKSAELVLERGCDPDDLQGTMAIMIDTRTPASSEVQQLVERDARSGYWYEPDFNRQIGTVGKNKTVIADILQNGAKGR